MKTVDSKLDQVFLAMLKFQEIEEILTKEDQYNYVAILTPLQLLDMLSTILAQSNHIPKVCSKIRLRFLEEISSIYSRKLGSQICQEDFQQTKSWSNQIQAMLNNTCPVLYNKYELLNLFLDISIAIKPLFDDDLAAALAQTICADLVNTPNFPLTCEAWSNFLPKFLDFDLPLHEDMLKTFQAQVGKMKPDQCLEAFISDANFQTREISDALFTQAVLVLDEKNETSTCKNLWNRTRNFISFGHQNVQRSDKLAHFFSKCFLELKCYQLPIHEAVRIATDLPAASKLIKIFPILMKSNLIKTEVVNDVRWILAQVNQFLWKLDNGMLLLETIAVLKETPRIDYLYSFQECIHEIGNNQSVFPVHQIRSLVQCRLQEMDEFYLAQTNCANFISRFHKTQIFGSVMSQFEVDPSQTFLAAICLPRTTSNEKVELKLGQITSEELETVKRFNDLHSRSIIFRHIHEEVVNYKLDQTWPNLMFIAHTILDKFEEFVLTLSHLETPIRQVQASFHEVLKNRRLQDELVVLGGAVNLSCWIPKVESAINQLFTINQHAEAAQAVKEVAAALGREEEFSIVETILDNTDLEDHPLSAINEELVQAGEIFLSWTPSQIKTLESLSKCRNLLNFLHENIKDRNGLKTFYDLASISAGESDLEVDRLRHFYHSVNGYSPLILDLNIDTCTFKEFQKACQGVFTALERDTKIAEKLMESSNRNLEWIKACKDQQGSVEQSSLAIVAKINQTGVYTVALPSMKTSNQLDYKGIGSCIKLSYQKVSNDLDPMKEMPWDEVQDLRSKLMLITAGAEGKIDVDRFCGILSLVELVTQHFIALCNAGCQLFTHWTLQVYFQIHYFTT